MTHRLWVASRLIKKFWEKFSSLRYLNSAEIYMPGWQSAQTSENAQPDPKLMIFWDLKNGVFVVEIDRTRSCSTKSTRDEPNIAHGDLWTRAFRRSCIEHSVRNIEVSNDCSDPDILSCQLDLSSSLILADRGQAYNYYNECISSHFFADFLASFPGDCFLRFVSHDQDSEPRQPDLLWRRIVIGKQLVAARP